MLKNFSIFFYNVFLYFNINEYNENKKFLNILYCKLYEGV